MSNTTDTTANLTSADTTADLTSADTTADLPLLPENPEPSLEGKASKTKAQLKAEKANTNKADEDLPIELPEEKNYSDKEVLEVIKDRVPESNPFKHKIIKTINELIQML